MKSTRGRHIYKLTLCPFCLQSFDSNPVYEHSTACFVQESSVYLSASPWKPVLISAFELLLGSDHSISFLPIHLETPNCLFSQSRTLIGPSFILAFLSLVYFRCTPCSPTRTRNQWWEFLPLWTHTSTSSALSPYRCSRYFDCLNKQTITELFSLVFGVCLGIALHF